MEQENQETKTPLDWSSLLLSEEAPAKQAIEECLRAVKRPQGKPKTT